VILWNYGGRLAAVKLFRQGGLRIHSKTQIRNQIQRKESVFMQNTLTTEHDEAMAREDIITAPAEPSGFNKKIGSTTYVVAVYSSRLPAGEAGTSAETLEDKILRLIESEVRESA
jgi:hypothetical protein